MIVRGFVLRVTIVVSNGIPGREGGRLGELVLFYLYDLQKRIKKCKKTGMLLNPHRRTDLISSKIVFILLMFFFFFFL